MKKGKRDRLEAAGWKVGSTADFLRLSPDEVAFIEMKLALGKEHPDKTAAPEAHPKPVGQAHQFESVTGCQDGSCRRLRIFGPPDTRIASAGCVATGSCTDHRFGNQTRCLMDSGPRRQSPGASEET